MSYNLLKCLALLFQIQFLYADPIVQLPNGLIRGREGVTLENQTYYAFHGIPYAAAPIGNLRFKPPQAASDWDGVRDGTQMTTTCFQRSSNTPAESEDCLFINVFTPQLPGEDKNVSLPVMLWIHGGGFVDGDGMNFYAPDLYANEHVILASINYRLGVFGFLSTQDEVIPGNNGLKDQQFALQWTHDNIHLFGGNPDLVTVFGQSAGSASVAYQLLNQKNQGLFAGAILESGSSLSPWAFQRRAREIAFTTASFLNSTFEGSDDSQALLDFLLTVDAEDLDASAQHFADTASGLEYTEMLQGIYYAPVVEERNPDAFLTRKMYKLLQSGNAVQVPILIGMTSEESLLFYQDADAFSGIMAAYDKHLDWIVPNDMQIPDGANRTQMGELIRDLYTSAEPLAEHLGDGLRYCTDESFSRSVIKHAEFYSEIAETYFYIFSYDGELFHVDTHYEGAGQVAHVSEVMYLFCSGDGCDISSFPESDRVTRRRLVKLWTDFAKYQNPTPEPSDLLQNITWPTVSTAGGDFFYLDIDEDLEIKNHPKWQIYTGWNTLYDSLSFDDFDTY